MNQHTESPNTKGTPQERCLVEKHASLIYNTRYLKKTIKKIINFYFNLKQEFQLNLQFNHEIRARNYRQLAIHVRSLLFSLSPLLSQSLYSSFIFFFFLIDQNWNPNLRHSPHLYIFSSQLNLPFLPSFKSSSMDFEAGTIFEEYSSILCLGIFLCSNLQSIFFLEKEYFS